MKNCTLPIVSQTSQIYDAPKFLVFKNSIYNTAHIMRILLEESTNQIQITMRDDEVYWEKINDISELWEKLQKVFTYGVTTNDNTK